MSDSHDAHGHGHGEAVYPYTPHHFHSAKQHLESGKMGVWLFLVTEILFFAGLFCAYTVYRALHPEVFYWAHFFLDTKMGALNTMVLIFSSFTAAWAVRNAQLGQKKLLQINIIITIACACIFMVVKYFEYSHKFHIGIFPAGHFDPHHQVWEEPSFKKKHPEAAEAAERIMAGIEARKNAQAAFRDEIVGERNSLALVPVQDDGSAKVAPTAAPAAPKTAPAAAPAPAPKTGPAASHAAAPTSAKALPAQADLEFDAESQEATPAGESSEEGAAEGEEESTTAEEGEAEAAESDAEATTEEKVAAAPKKEELSDEAWLLHQINELSDEERHPLEMAGVIRSPADGPLEFARPAKAGVFFSIYFFMTGLHGFHVLVGIGLWIWMLFIVKKREMGQKYFGPIEFTALYWHLVDLIWIYLFPMLYLIH